MIVVIAALIRAGRGLRATVTGSGKVPSAGATLTQTLFLVRNEAGEFARASRAGMRERAQVEHAGAVRGVTP